MIKRTYKKVNLNQLSRLPLGCLYLPVDIYISHNPRIISNLFTNNTNNIYTFPKWYHELGIYRK